ncbi:MAG: hypothetical protein EON92_12085 [Burkholderiales bacterium]|nr:MAG: hypothetical protein EON92_12085 [Burkholderiales bacterium]
MTATLQRSLISLLRIFVATLLCAASLLAAAQDGKGGDTILKDRAAWNSAQGKALAEFLNAARSSDKTTLKRLLVPHQSSTLDGPNAGAFLEHLKRSSLDPNLATFDSLAINARGSSALATISGRYEGGEITKRYTITKSDAGWWVAI